MRRILVIVLIGAALGLGVYFSPAFVSPEKKPTPPVHLQTGGTSTAALIIENGWRAAYRMQKGIEVDYESTGSTKGIEQMIEGTYPIAFTHSPITDAQKKKAKDKNGDLVQMPVVLCSVVPIYNIKGLKNKPPINFTGEVLAKIFLGTITRWNDPELKKINEGVDLPDTKITVVHRKDSSGTTFLFTDYLAGVSPEWDKKVGKGSEVKWPVGGEGENRTFDLVRQVKRTEGAIGYADLVYAFFGDVKYGAVQNKDKTAFIHAKAKNMTAAAKEELSTIRDDLGFDLTNKSGKESYPICGAIWAVCYQNQPAKTRSSVVNFLQWATHDGQKYTSEVYASLPEEVVGRVEKKLQLIKDGKDSKDPSK